MDEELSKDVLDFKLVREMFDRSGHYAVLAKIKSTHGNVVGVAIVEGSVRC